MDTAINRVVTGELLCDESGRSMGVSLADVIQFDPETEVHLLMYSSA